MATKKFITKNGILSNNVQFVDEIGNSTQSITLTMDSLGTLSFDGTNGQLFSVTDNMSGTIFSVNDISGIPSIEVIDDGTIRLAEFSGNVLVGTATDDGINKLQVNGDSIFSGQVDVGHDLIITNKNGSNPADAGNLYFQEAGTTWGTDFYGFRFNHEGSLNYLKLQSANLTNVIDVMTIIRDSGNVGIGKIPTQKLDVNGNIAVSGTVDGRDLAVDGAKLDGIAPNANNYVLPASVVHDNEVSALHATDALRVSGTTLSLYKGDGTFESVTTQDTIYTHPTTDGNKHVPANGTTNTGKVLTASATAGVYTWETPSTGVTDHTLLTNIGTNTHAQIDTHIADGTKHFTMGSISITESQISDFGSYSLSTHNHDTAYLGINATAANSQLLDNKDSTDFLELYRAVGDVANIDTSGSTYVFAHDDSSYTLGTLPPGAHNGTGIISLHTHSGSYTTQLALSTNTNELFVRSDNNTGTFGTWAKVWTDANDGTTSALVAGSAGKWATARTITLSGDVSGSVSIDGSANVTMSNTVVANDSHTHSNYLVTTSAPVFGTDTITSRTANTSLSLAGNGTGSVYVNDSLVVTGDLTIQGTTTTLNTADLLVEDKNIVIGNVATPSDTTADGGGITLLGTTNKTILWSDATNTWDFNQGLNITGTVTATSFSGSGAGLTSLNADTLGSVAASNYTRLDTTNLGKTTPTSDTVTNTAAEWSALPVGYSSFMSATIGTAGGAPVNNFGYFTKIANRDTSGGWSGLWSGYSAGQHYLGRAATNADLATWEKIWTDANDGSGSGLDADKLDGQEGSYYRNASNINAGTINDAYLPATISSNITGNAATATTADNVSATLNDTFTGTYNLLWDASNITYQSNLFQVRGSDDTLIAPNFEGNGSGLTSLNASNISSGTIGVSYLPTSIVRSDIDDVISGDIEFNNAALSYTSSQGGIQGIRVMQPQGGLYTTNTASVTGYIKITLPVSWTNTMMMFDIDLYDYAGGTDGESIRMRVGGYNYQPSAAWNNVFATVISGRTDKFFNVRFGHDGTKCAIYIGEVDSGWNYPQVSVSNFVGGYSTSTSATFADGWAVGFTTTLGTITQTKALENIASYALTANTATTLATARSINGTSFNGSAAITTANWGTARTLTIGNTGKSVNGSAAVSWSLSEIGAEPAFTKNTGFNKNFGTTTGTVAQGDDSRINNGQTAFTWGNHATAGYLTSVTGADVTLSTTNFNGNLSSLENTVQKAFDKLDDIAAGASTTKTISEAIATQGQTTFSVSYTVGKIEVFVGGVKVKPGNYTASNGTSVVLDFGVDEGTWVQFVTDDNAVPGTLDWGAITGTPNTLAGYGMSVSFSDLSLHPTTIAGYGITDAFDGAFSSLTGVPNTIAGYGIIDAFDGAFSSLTGLPTTLASHGITNPGFLGGTPTTTTQAQGDRTTTLATTEFVQNEVNPEITYISSAQHNNLMMIIGGKLYTASGSSAANANSGTGRGLDAQMNTYGVEEAREVVFPDETASTLLQAGGDGLVANFALFDNGNLYTWGRNDNAACGLGHTTAVGVPTLAATNVAKVWSTPFENYSITSQSLIIQKTDGYLYGCGENNDGELGLGNTTSPITSFTQMTWAGTNPIYVYNSNGWGGMTLVQKSDGTIWTCGYQNQGALFNGVSSASPLSTPVDITANVGGAAAGNVVIARHTYGYYNTAAVVASCSMLMRRTGAGVTSVYTVGDNGWGAIGNGTTTDTVTPYAVPNMSDVADITWCGDIPSILALKTNGDLWGWGRNSEGQMGDGTINSKLTPAVIATGVSKILSRDVATNTYGYQFPMFILKNDNFVYGTGFNTTYQLGLGDTTNKTAWTRLNIPSDDPVKMIGSLSSTGSTKGTIAVTEKNNLWVWGSNNNNTLSPHTASHIIYPTKMRINAGSN